MISKTQNKDRYLKDLYNLKERIRVEILGQENAEYRQDLVNLMEKVDIKIKETQNK